LGNHRKDVCRTQSFKETHRTECRRNGKRRGPGERLGCAVHTQVNGKLPRRHKVRGENREIFSAQRVGYPHRIRSWRRILRTQKDKGGSSSQEDKRTWGEKRSALTGFLKETKTVWVVCQKRNNTKKRVGHQEKKASALPSLVEVGSGRPGGEKIRRKHRNHGNSLETRNQTCLKFRALVFWGGGGWWGVAETKNGLKGVKSGEGNPGPKWLKKKSMPELRK